MRTRLFLILFCSVFLVTITSRTISAGECALIIGIDKYPLIGNPLNNAVSDATGVANKLKEIGFAAENVELQTDVDLDAMEDAFEACLTMMQNSKNRISKSCLTIWASHNKPQRASWARKTKAPARLPPIKKAVV